MALSSSIAISMATAGMTIAIQSATALIQQQQSTPGDCHPEFSLTAFFATHPTMQSNMP